MRYRVSQDGVLRVSEIGLGTYAMAGVYGEKDPGQFREVLRKAFDLGVTFFDTAPGYGDAERVVGEVLGDVRAEIVISTKVAAHLEGGPSCSFDSVISSCERSLDRLGTDYIDLYQLHFDDGTTPTEEVVRAFENLKAAGRIRAYGIGHVSLQRAGEYVRTGSISTVMGELNAVSRRYYSKMLPLVRTGARYIGFSLTGRGILSGAIAGRDGLAPTDIRRIDAVFAGERLQSALRIRDRMAEVAADLGAAPAQVAIRWAVAQEGVLTGLVGPSSTLHLEEDLGASDMDLPASVMSELDALVSEEEVELAARLRQEVISILQTEIKDATAAPAVVYAIEALAELGLVSDADLMTHMRSVMKTMKDGACAGASLDAIRKDLLHYVSSQ